MIFLRYYIPDNLIDLSNGAKVNNNIVIHHVKTKNSMNGFKNPSAMCIFSSFTSLSKLEK